jgi:hypothetical protein
MAVLTLDAVFSGLRQPQFISKSITATLVAGRAASLWSLAGMPGAGTFDTTLNGVVLSSTSALVSGQIPHYDPAAGNSYLAYINAMATQAGTLLVLDRLWHNGGYTITTTGAQNSTTPTWPSRCPTSGTDDTPSTNGQGVLVSLEVSAAAGAASPAPTLTYTNQAGTGSRTAGLTQTTNNSPAIGATWFFGLQAGDTGVRSVQSLALNTSWVSGTVNLAAYRLLASIPLQANIPTAADALTGLGTRVYNGTVPWLVFIPNTTTASIVTGVYTETQG